MVQSKKGETVSKNEMVMQAMSSGGKAKVSNKLRAALYRRMQVVKGLHEGVRGLGRIVLFPPPLPHTVLNPFLVDVISYRILANHTYTSRVVFVVVQFVVTGNAACAPYHTRGRQALARAALVLAHTATA